MERSIEAVVQGKIVHTYDTKNSIIRVPKHKKVVVCGVEDFIIVDENDVLLIYPKSREQEIKQVSQKVMKDVQDSPFLKPLT